MDWTLWEGGQCPVDDESLVDIHWFGEWGFDGIQAKKIDWRSEAPFSWRLHEESD